MHKAARAAVSVLKILFPSVITFAPASFKISTSCSSSPPSGPIITPIFRFSLFFNFVNSFFSVLSFSFSYVSNTISYLSIKLQIFFIFTTLFILGTMSLPDCFAATSEIFCHLSIFFCLLFSSIFTPHPHRQQHFLHC